MTEIEPWVEERNKKLLSKKLEPGIMIQAHIYGIGLMKLAIIANSYGEYEHAYVTEDKTRFCHSFYSGGKFLNGIPVMGVWPEVKKLDEFSRTFVQYVSDSIESLVIVDGYDNLLFFYSTLEEKKSQEQLEFCKSTGKNGPYRLIRLSEI